MKQPLDTLTIESQIESLRQQLLEAEELQRAITRGEVDAFVVGPDDSKRVLMLSGAYARYRQLVEMLTAEQNRQQQDVAKR